MRDNEEEDARKRGGRINGGGTFTIPILEK